MNECVLFQDSYFYFIKLGIKKTFSKKFLLVYIYTAIAIIIMNFFLCDLRMAYYILNALLTERVDLDGLFIYNKNENPIFRIFFIFASILFMQLLLDLPTNIARKIRKKCINSLYVFSNSNPLFIYSFVNSSEKNHSQEYVNKKNFFYFY